ncbi:hypothetical protein NL676_037388 [Syzygium grande]|nr:hypothetical protein NL676_037388 [Syzygium grande]
MGTAVVPSSMEVSIPLGDQKDNGFAGRPNPKDLDTGALFFIYLLYKPDGKMQLYQLITMFGGLNLFLAQVPSFHSLRHINLVSLIICLAYSVLRFGRLHPHR